ncbi:MAG: outer membrane beta-barrel protein [Marinoscillum sp.]
MKIHLILYLLMTLSSGLLFAQTESGSLFLGGATSFNSGFGNAQTKADGSTVDGSERSNFSLNLSPNVQYFVIDNLAIGVSLSTAYSSTKNEVGKSASSSYGIGPSVTYLFGSKSYKPFLSGGFSFNQSQGKTTIDTNESTFNSSSFSYNAGGGVAIFFNDKFACNMGLHFGQNRSIDTGDRVYTNTGVSARVGFLIKLK